MSDSRLHADERALAALAALSAAVDDVLAFELSSCSDDALVSLLTGMEEQRRRLAAVDHRQIAEIDQRGLAIQRGFARTEALVAARLRIDRPEATARVAAARELGPRRELSGGALEPIFPSVAASSAQGAISATHARIVTATVEALPGDVAAEQDRDIEAFLVEQARQFDPRTLRVIARRLLDTVDPDGTLSSAADRARRRQLTAHQRPDGSVHGTFDTDPITGEALLTVLDTLARPQPADDTGLPDPRSTAQRRHDAFREVLMLALRSGELPACGGVSATILITMTADQAATGHGLATTGHGALIPTATAVTFTGEAQLQTITLDAGKAITAYSSTQRVFTQQQRLAMTARDGGCSVPGCTMPPALTEAHHIVEWSAGGRTSIDNGTLVCASHHRELPIRGWRCIMQDGIPHWIAPSWLDRTQTPRRNMAHHPEHALAGAWRRAPADAHESSKIGETR
jgi:hypothetical protein